VRVLCDIDDAVIAGNQETDIPRQLRTEMRDRALNLLEPCCPL
jgi:hypothetical protein